MKQPAKLSLAGLFLAVVVALLVPQRHKAAPPGGATAPTTAPSSAPLAPPSLPSAPSGPAVRGEERADDGAVRPSGPAAARPPRAPSSTGSGSTTAPSPAPWAEGPARAPEDSLIGFTSKRAWQEHFQKHGAEFGKISAQEYLARARALRDAPLSATVVERVRDDGVITRFDRDSGAFIAFHEDRTIRTFFRPDGGEAYFERQAER